jgi:serine/threonine-protein kinase RsbW
MLAQDEDSSRPSDVDSQHAGFRGEISESAGSAQPEIDSRPGLEGHATDARCLRLLLRPDLAEVQKARRLVEDIHDLCGLPEERTFDIKVAVSEACANAIEHSGSAALVVAWLLQDRVLFEITNDGGFLPGLRKDTDGRRRGLGLPLMASLADQLHVSRLETGATRITLTFFLAPR